MKTLIHFFRLEPISLRAYIICALTGCLIAALTGCEKDKPTPPQAPVNHCPVQQDTLTMLP